VGQLLEHLRVSTFVGVVLESTLTVGLLDIVIAGSGVDAEEVAIIVSFDPNFAESGAY